MDTPRAQEGLNLNVYRKESLSLVLMRVADLLTKQDRGKGRLATPSKQWPFRSGIPAVSAAFANHPFLYKAWQGVTVVAAAFTGVFVPWQLAFGDMQGFYSSPPSIPAILNMLLMGIFLVDLFLKPIQEKAKDPKGPRMVDWTGACRRELDVLGVLPLDLLVLMGLNFTGASPDHIAAVLPYISALRLTQMVRLYRVPWLFRYLEYDLTVDLLWVTVVRNLLLIAFMTHWVACGFEFLARQGGFPNDLLVGTNPELFRSLSFDKQYLYSLYWSVTTLAGNEWNGVDNVQTIEEVVANTLRAGVFLVLNIALGAYILGTISLLVVKSDERAGHFRELSANLKHYSVVNDLPEELKDTMQDHLKLNFNCEDVSDEKVLSIYPTTIRRRILRHLYLQQLRSTYLFNGVPQKFLDSLLCSARVELYMPGVEVLAAGDSVNELFLVVQGQVELRSPLDDSSSLDDPSLNVARALGEFMDAEPSDIEESFLGQYNEDRSITQGPPASVAAFHKHTVLAQGTMFGDISFFTGVPQLEAVRSLTTTRIMVIPRSAYDNAQRNFPVASRLVLANLQNHAEALVEAEFPNIVMDKLGRPHKVEGPRGHSATLELIKTSPRSLMYSWASPELVELMSRNGRGGSSSSSLLYGTWSPTEHGFTARQELVISNLIRVQAMIERCVAKQDEERTMEFLYAASRGDCEKISTMLQQGFPPDMCDYDGRSAMMLACVKGHEEVVTRLLVAGANPHLKDNLGGNAILEACMNGHDGLIDKLLSHGASVGEPNMKRMEVAARLCSCVFEGNLPLLRRLLKAKAPVDAGDYDKRTALHISSAEGNLAAVRLLIEEGGAKVDVKDRWGYTPLDEARRVGAQPVVNYLIDRLELAGCHEGCLRHRSPSM